MVIKIKNLGFSYDKKIGLLQNINFSFKENKLTIISGNNGCGKSTLLKIIAGIIKPTHGNVTIDEKNIHDMDPSERIRRVVYMPQDARKFFTFKSGRDQLVFILENLRIPYNDILSLINKVVEKFSLEKLIDRPIKNLSGGELQRLMIAIIFSLKSDYILLDEPFSNLDVTNQLFLMNLIKTTSKSKFIIVDHNYKFYSDMEADNLIITNKHIEPNFEKSINNFINECYVKCSNLNNDYQLFWQNLSINIDNYNYISYGNFKFPQKSIGFLIGSNGSGKSTLFNILLKQKKFNTGLIRFNDVDINHSSIKKWTSYITLGFQNSENQFITTKISDEIRKAQKVSHQRKFWNDEKTYEWICKLDLQDIIDKSPYFISGGQKKKLQVLILAIISSPLILLDEIFTGLDNVSVDNVWDLILLMKKLGSGVLITSHFPDNFRYYDFIMKINNHKLNILKKGDIIFNDFNKK